MLQKHKAIINMIDQLLSMPETDEDGISNEVKKLLNYLQECFTKEEEIMISAKYADYDTHKENHSSILVNYVELMRLFKKEGACNLHIQSVRNQLLPGIIDHITKTDHSFIEACK